MMSFASSLTS